MCGLGFVWKKTQFCTLNRYVTDLANLCHIDQIWDKHVRCKNVHRYLRSLDNIKGKDKTNLQEIKQTYKRFCKAPYCLA